MTDPAIEARAKAIARIGDGLAGVSLGYAVECGAREALRPIRESHQHLTKMASGESLPVWTGMMAVLNVLAPLIFTTEELGL